ncbi:hypothetical protein AURDEDRAFT_172438 [Auricularia subglabra TFB-10046 SS5]|nr:hypothetical protein AURDEDRAFT_172438 [Auricularia subglabra TFB-10046 SS5]
MASLLPGVDNDLTLYITRAKHPKSTFYTALYIVELRNARKTGAPADLHALFHTAFAHAQRRLAPGSSSGRTFKARVLEQYGNEEQPHAGSSDTDTKVTDGKKASDTDTKVTDGKKAQGTGAKRAGIVRLSKN